VTTTPLLEEVETMDVLVGMNTLIPEMIAAMSTRFNSQFVICGNSVHGRLVLSCMILHCLFVSVLYS